MRAISRALAGLALVVMLPASALAFRAPAPASIAIPSIGMTSNVVPLAQNEDGSMQAPDDPDTVGWFSPGPSIGQPGNAILDGHVDWAGRLRTFGRLRVLQPGDQIDVTNSEGETLSYAVEWNRQYAVDTFPSEVWAQPEDGQEITLITCGGVFDPATRSYLARIVVRAQRV